MRRTTILFPAILITAIGCTGAMPTGGSDGNTSSGGGSTTPTPETCSASLTAGMQSYTISAGDQLSFGGMTLTRISHGANGLPIYGVWSLPSATAGTPLTLVTSLEIEPSTVSLSAQCTLASESATAMVVSPATVTDSVVTILDDEQDTETLR